MNDYAYGIYASPVGELTIASDGEAVCGLWIEGQKYHGLHGKGASIPKELRRDDDAPGLRELREWLDRYFAGDRPDTGNVPLAPIGSEFRQLVWQELLAIPYGEVRTYGDISRAITEKRGRSSAIAVGGAVGHNPISILIPCHRVLGSDGSLTGYAGGLDKKVWLLEHEGANLPS